MECFYQLRDLWWGKKRANEEREKLYKEVLADNRVKQLLASKEYQKVESEVDVLLKQSNEIGAKMKQCKPGTAAFKRLGSKLRYLHHLNQIKQTDIMSKRTTQLNILNEMCLISNAHEGRVNLERQKELMANIKKLRINKDLTREYTKIESKLQEAADKTRDNKDGERDQGSVLKEFGQEMVQMGQEVEGEMDDDELLSAYATEEDYVQEGVSEDYLHEMASMPTTPLGMPLVKEAPRSKVQVVIQKS